MNEFLQVFGAVSLGLLSLTGACAIIAGLGGFSSAGDSSDEWEESENSESERSITVEEFCTVMPPYDAISNEPPAIVPQLVKRTTKKTTLKTSGLSRPRANA